VGQDFYTLLLHYLIGASTNNKIDEKYLRKMIELKYLEYNKDNITDFLPKSKNKQSDLLLKGTNDE